MGQSSIGTCERFPAYLVLVVQDDAQPRLLPLTTPTRHADLIADRTIVSSFEETVHARLRVSDGVLLHRQLGPNAPFVGPS